ncbi:MAG: hypothetical protein HY718_19560 [Planctomycetes bacterium]|nr:hypothetical protein [Planctomycetota bacterium]
MGSKIITWVKSHLTLVVCSSLGLVSVALLVLGMILPDSQALLESDRQVYSNLQGAAAKVANERVIEEVRRQQSDIRRNVERFLARAARTSPHALLRSDVFPAPKERMAPNFCVEDADKKRKELLALLNAKDRPQARDIEEYREEMLRLEQKRQRESGMVPGASPTGKSALPGVPVVPAPSLGLIHGTDAGGGAPSAENLENLTPEELVRRDPTAGASLKRAHEIHCYAAIEALDARNQIAAKDPPVELMWESQVSLWIQEDIIQALARLNNEVAAQLPEEERWVGNLPIKHLLYIAVGPYLAKLQDSGVIGLGGGGGTTIEVGSPTPPVNSHSAAFTQRQASEALDVIYLSVGLVIDANYLLRVIDEIGKTGFYTCLSTSYEATASDPLLRDFVYGSGPLLRVRLELEHCILRNTLTVRKDDKSSEQLKYIDLMPASIKAGTYLSDASRGGTIQPVRPPMGRYPDEGFMPRGLGRERRGREME